MTSTKSASEASRRLLAVFKLKRGPAGSKPVILPTLLPDICWTAFPEGFKFEDYHLNDMVTILITCESRHMRTERMSDDMHVFVRNVLEPVHSDQEFANDLADFLDGSD